MEIRGDKKRNAIFEYIPPNSTTEKQKKIKRTYRTNSSFLFGRKTKIIVKFKHKNKKSQDNMNIVHKFNE